MPQETLLPHDMTSDTFGEFLTFIVPAPDGCNLKCGYCFIAQRREISRTRLRPTDYARFIEGVAEVEPVIAVAIQGHEPLLPASMPYARAILRAAGDRGIPTSLVTNGAFLRAAHPQLAGLSLARICISLDAAIPDRHDRLRGVAGAWSATIDSIAATVEAIAAAGTRLTVTSVLMPRRRIYLDGIPERLRTLGVRDWIVNPLTIIGRDAWAGADSLQRLLDDLLTLDTHAKARGITMTVDDTPGRLKSRLMAIDAERAASLAFCTLPAGVTLSRLTPNGHCAVGAEIGRLAPSRTIPWDTSHVGPAHFLQESRRRIAAAGDALQMA